MTGKVGGAFDLEYVTLNDSFGNNVSLPKLTAITLTISGKVLKEICRVFISFMGYV